jgi:hypothetical protein
MLGHVDALEVAAEPCWPHRCFRGSYRVMLGHVGALEVAAELCQSVLLFPSDDLALFRNGV